MSEFAPMSLEEITKVAEKKNCDVMVARDDELQFDLDSDDAVKRNDAFLRRLAEAYKGTHIAEWRSSGGKTHRVAQHAGFARMSVEARIAMQAMGASGEGREFAALHCFWAGSKTPVLLFRPKTNA